MQLSVVVCTRNRARHLPQMLEALTRLQAPAVPWELLLVDNGSTDETAAVLARFCASSGLPVRLLGEPEQGLSNARNTGWRSATGAVVAFTDDDCYARQDWLIAVLAAFADPDAAYAGGRVLLFDPEDAPVTIQPCEAPVRILARSHVESGGIIGANFACRRSMLQALGGFDPHLGAGSSLLSGEDTDLMIRASAAGFEGRYAPSLVVYHHHRRRRGGDVATLYAGYARGRGALSMKALLQPATRGLYAQNWYWRLRSLVRERRFMEGLYELQGAVQYLAVRASAHRFSRRRLRTAPETPSRTPPNP